ncbi:hypothetical protein PLICRDRAFT_251321 [Plicaturopsis crispa FD-325 SS-3]|nr:hypothetical protein PLICRDRAFT_251321 [Plicaturopsis crispa FD-325 SS-3]
MRRKTDWIILPLCQVAIMMGAVDKVCIGTAAVFGFRTDTHLVGQEYSWVSSIIYFGCIAAVFPSLWVMQSLPAAKWITFNVGVWGILMMCMAAAKNFGSLIAIRFILGLFESIISAGFGLILSMWFTRSEQPWRTAVIFSTLSSVVNGLLSYGCASIPTGSMKIKSWQLLFLLVGGITFCWSILCYFFLPDSPTTARWLTDRQKVIAVRRTKDNHTGMENKTFKMYQLLEAFMDPKMYLVFFINIALNIPNGGVLTFNSIIVSSLGYTTKQTLLLAIPTGVISWVSSIIFSWMAVKTGQRCLTAMLSCVIPLLATILLHVIPRSNISGSLGALFLVFTYWGPYIVVSAIVFANTGGYTKKTVTYAVGYLGYATGNLIGPQTFKAEQAPEYQGGVIAMLTCYCAAIVLIGVYGLYCRHLNALKRAHRSELAATAVDNKENLLDEWLDQTDFENPNFVYVC